MLSVTPNIIPCKRESSVQYLCDQCSSSKVPHSARAALRYQFIIDSLDVWLPATNLGLVHFNDGILGFTGFVFPSHTPRTRTDTRFQNSHIHHGTADTMARGWCPEMIVKCGVIHTASRRMTCYYLHSYLSITCNGYRVVQFLKLPC